MHICYHFYTVHYTVYHSKKTKKRRCAQLHAVDEWCLLSVWRGDRSEEAKTPHLKSAVPPILAKQESLLWARVYVSLQVFPPTALHPILLNKGTWGSGLKWEWLMNGEGQIDMWRFVRWVPNLSTADYHSLMSTPVCVCLCVSLSLLLCRGLLFPLQLCAAPEWPMDHRCSVNRETHTSVIKAVGGLVLYQVPPIPLFKARPPHIIQSRLPNWSLCEASFAPGSFVTF